MSRPTDDIAILKTEEEIEEEIKEEERKKKEEEMKNKLITQEPNANFNQLQNQINQAILQQQLLIKDDIEKLNTRLDIMSDERELDKEIWIKEQRRTESLYEYLTLGDFGRKQFKVAIGRVVLGRLFRVVGIAQRGRAETIPYQEMINEGFAKTWHVDGKYPTYAYNPDKCIRKIDRWLKKHDIKEDFYSIQDEKELKEYINYLYEVHG